MGFSPPEDTRQITAKSSGRSWTEVMSYGSSAGAATPCALAVHVTIPGTGAPFPETSCASLKHLTPFPLLQPQGLGLAGSRKWQVTRAGNGQSGCTFTCSSSRSSLPIDFLFSLFCPGFKTHRQNRGLLCPQNDTLGEGEGGNGAWKSRRHRMLKGLRVDSV